MWGKTEQGTFIALNGQQIIKLSPATNSIRFKLELEQISHGFVVGDFNNWQKQACYKLAWHMDYNDGKLKLCCDISFTPPLAAGCYNFSYALIDVNGNELLVSASNQHFQALEFSWPQLNQELLIKTSAPQIYRGHYFELVAVRTSNSNRQEVVAVTWQYSPQHNAIQLNDNQLWVDPNARDLEQITISCLDPLSGKLLTKQLLISDAPAASALIHFLVPSGNYQGDNYSWDIWAFEHPNGTATALNFSSHSDYGMTAWCPTNRMIIRKRSWGLGWHNDWSEQTPTFAIEQNVANYYIIQGDPQLYTSLSQVVWQSNPQIIYAVLDDGDKICAYLSKQPPVATSFSLYINGVHQTEVLVFIKDECKQVIFTNLPKAIDPRSLIEIRASNTFLPAKVHIRNYLNRYYYNGHDLGLTFDIKHIHLRLWAPTAIKVNLLLFAKPSNDPNQDQAEHRFTLSYSSMGTHSLSIEREQFENYYYLYCLTFADLDKQGNHCLKTSYAVDPYASAVSCNGKLGVLLDLTAPQVTPDNWQHDPRPPLTHKEDAIIYELHIRDFSFDPSSGVTKPHRGKFLGLAEAATQLNLAHKPPLTTGLASLLELGITHVHLLPIFDFATVDEDNSQALDNRNWGYDPQNYNAPEGSYASDSHNPATRILELRQMIKRLHQHGLRVIMDVVYNHMYDTSNLNNIVPGYYFRSNPLGQLTNGSGCGNELASERPMVRKFILDSIKHWLTNYHLDGIRFDLMELIDFTTMCQVEELALSIDPSILIYGEPWKGGDSPLTNGTYRGSQKGHQFAIFNDSFRDAIRGNNNPGHGFVNGEAHNPAVSWSVIEGLKGSISWAMAKPGESINYVDAHDNYTLWDQLVLSTNHPVVSNDYHYMLTQDLFASPIVRQYLLAIGIILTAQGIPFLHGGVELLRSKLGDHNSYKSSDHINAFNWQNKAIYLPIFNYIRGLIQLRRHHPAFRMRDSATINRHLTINHAYNIESSGVIIAHFRNYANGDSWQDIIVIYNATAIDDYPIQPILPISEKRLWHIVVDHQTAGTTPIASFVSDQLPGIKAHSLLVMYS